MQRLQVSASLCQSVILSGSPSRKRLQRYALFPFLQLLRNTFLRIFWRNFVNYWEQEGYRWIFFDAAKSGRERSYIMYFARARTCAHIYSHRQHIFSRNSRHFLCFPLGKRMFPPWKTYVSRQGNICFSCRKHRKHRGNGELSHRHFFNMERLKGKNTECIKTDRTLTRKNKQALTGKTEETA